MTEGEKLWNLIKDLTDTLYATHPSERLGLCEPIIQEEFPDMPQRTVEGIGNTILRFVMWMCEQDSANQHNSSPKIDLDQLAYLYEVEKMNGYEIAEMLDIPRGSIYKFLNDAQTDMRSKSEAQKLVNKPHLQGGPAQDPSEPL